MIKKLGAFCKKHKDILSYLFFGGLTTLVAFMVYTPLYQYLHVSAALSNILSWVAAVAFAFLTNKPFVFQSHDWSAAVVLPELGKFVSCRIGSGLLETGILALTVDLMHCSGILMKVITSILVVILNYMGSKLLVFRK